MGQQTGRQSLYKFVAGFRVGATVLELAAALNAAADHYDAETARLVETAEAAK